MFTIQSSHDQTQTSLQGIRIDRRPVYTSCVSIYYANRYYNRLEFMII